MKAHGADPLIIHYLDDYLCVCDGKEACEKSLAIMLDTCQQAGFTVQDKKTVKPTKCLEFLGIIIDLTAGTLEISHDRMCEITNELQGWMGRTNCVQNVSYCLY